MTDLTPRTKEADEIKREMERLATDARAIVSQLSGRNKFELAYAHGWWDLMETVDAERVIKALPTESRVELRRLGARWMFLHRRLEFLTKTRPVWNT
jgi:hypothetical protein